MGFPITVDTHAHLTMEDYDEDRSTVIERGRGEGVSFIEVGFDVLSSHKGLSLAGDIGGKCAVGIHPHYAQKDAGGLESAWKRVEDLLTDENRAIVAVGETGLDFARNLSARGVQEECFSIGLDLARRKRLPVIVHQREAEKEVISQVKAAGVAGPVIFHCFTGDTDYARKCLDLGGYLGLGGVLTYPRNQTLRDAVKYLPLDRILLETDSPYLAPQFRRGKRNEPSFVLEVRDLVAELLGFSGPSVSDATTDNASRAFSCDFALADKAPDR